MKKSLVHNIVVPILTRLGTALGAALVGIGLAAEHGPTVESLVVALGLLGVDLAFRKVLK